jgi:hypothetical protein
MSAPLRESSTHGDIPPGTGRANRIGDRIKPLSMSINLWLATILPLDTDRGVKAYYDRVFTTNLAVTGNGRESHMIVKINLLRKESRDIVYDSANQNIVNSPLLLYVIPYDSYGTLITDNITSYSYSMRMRYKDA